MDRTMTQTESDFLEFVNHVITESVGIGAKCSARGQRELGIELMSLASVAGKKRRELLGLPEPDPDVDYDPDCHWDGTERLPGEPRRERGENFSDTLDLSALKPRQGETEE